VEAQAGVGLEADGPGSLGEAVFGELRKPGFGDLFAGFWREQFFEAPEVWVVFKRPEPRSKSSCDVGGLDEFNDLIGIDFEDSDRTSRLLESFEPPYEFWDIRPKFLFDSFDE
jgi:hypothetical protein